MQKIFPDVNRVRAAYWFTTTRGEFRFHPRGYFDLDDTEAAARFHDGISTIVAGIRGGVFPANPGRPDRGSSDNCRFCDFNSLCLARRLEIWERKKNDPFADFLPGVGRWTRRRRPTMESSSTARQGTTGVAPEGRFVPSDQEARDIIENRLDETLFVEASAGTGKTYSLVARVVNLVAEGRTTLDRIAAITFTEAAAAELRHRIREKLEEAAGEATDVDRLDRCRQGIEDLDQATIRTLHSFAGMLLRESPLEAGLPPGFETNDEIAAGIKFNEAWDAWLDAVLTEDSPLAPHLSLAFIQGLTLNNLKAVALAFHANYADLPDAAFDPGPPPDCVAAQTLLAQWPAVERLCRFSRLGDDDRLVNHVQAKRGALRRLSETEPGSVPSYRLLDRVWPLSRNVGRQSDWDNDPQTGINACKALKDLLAD